MIHILPQKRDFRCTKHREDAFPKTKNFILLQTAYFLKQAECLLPQLCQRNNEKNPSRYNVVNQLVYFLRKYVNHSSFERTLTMQCTATITITVEMYQK